VVREQLGRSPVEIAQSAHAQGDRRHALGVHTRRDQQNLEGKVNHAGSAVVFVVQVRKGFRVAGRARERAAKRRKRIQCHDPWRDRGRKILGEKGA
jgi:hypothetical protein